MLINGKWRFWRAAFFPFYILDILIAVVDFGSRPMENTRLRHLDKVSAKIFPSRRS